ncbi:cytochrome c oxidase accessory protein CcoG [Parasphingopyxis sp. CP4]|uniref:cytochrome c oxidase accessory protein CcoG n=1 Tax=Parasphingopyxis sp. CP4 TaxID=2724527 RepID=UPI0015A25038|nr:cytochrome c oxidase accessory protein CcoG [Parasphingopyxis sp. CP4]QLC20794.1 cytochrome c oxidase accessory protein CcoG [Parasphingopyxis sp. CP4]
MSAADSAAPDGPPKPQLYEKRKGVYPKAVTGNFRRLKWVIMLATLAIYYLTPWIRWDRGPYAPDQAVLVDLAGRRFYMFGIEIWPHEFYYVAGLLIMAGIGLFIVTSSVGRAWCGYACPQTVWTDLFQHVERWVDGDRNAQIRLEKSPWTAKKVAKRSTKWTIWLLIAMATGGAWIFYFADAPTLFWQFFTGEAPFVAYATVGVLTFTTFTLGGFMREQVCIYMCPWPRIQTAMMDEKSLTVTYKDWRGEPRSRGMKRAKEQPGVFGDCIDCNQCVAVCPTGIDIREGPQIGCITCALCIDACDDIMDQVGRPRGLIDYATLESAETEQAGEPTPPLKRSVFRPRTMIYFALWAGIGLAMLFAVGTRDRLTINAIQDRNPTFVQLSDGHVRNSFDVRVRNMENRPREMTLGLEGLEGAVMWSGSGNRDQALRSFTISVPPDQLLNTRVFVAAPFEGEASEDFAFTVSAGEGDDAESAIEAARFTRPGGE